MSSSQVLRGAPLRSSPFTQARPIKQACSRSFSVTVEANKKVQKKTKVILTQDHINLGKEGEIKVVPVGYWRNFLLPTGVAKIADASILEAIRKKKEDEVRARLEVKAQAKAFATALATIGKFIIKKKVGDKDQIFGSVSAKEVAEAIYQQTGRVIPEADFSIPDIKSVGTYEATVKLHPEVNGTFSIVIMKEKVLTVKASPAGKKK